MVILRPHSSSRRDGADGLGIVDAGGVRRVEPDTATTVAAVGRGGSRRPDRDGCRDECESDEHSSYDLHAVDRRLDLEI